MVVLEKDCSGQQMYRLIQELLADQQRRDNMGEALRNLVRLDSTERICDIVEELAKN